MYCETGLGEKVSVEEVKWCLEKKASLFINEKVTGKRSPKS